ncbi:hypothetical protein MUP77_21960 [Candidatus Bathyarchaeota archaeon]|nr:hypothetical protein [Candidatus Bathyarchaeota archaeon]
MKIVVLSCIASCGPTSEPFLRQKTSTKRGILGQFYPVRMKIDRINAFSAHVGMDDLERWLNNFKSQPKRIFLTMEKRSRS